jgi:hypothetical protein
MSEKKPAQKKSALTIPTPNPDPQSSDQTETTTPPSKSLTSGSGPKASTSPTAAAGKKVRRKKKSRKGVSEKRIPKKKLIQHHYLVIMNPTMPPKVLDFPSLDDLANQLREYIVDPPPAGTRVLMFSGRRHYLSVGDPKYLLVSCGNPMPLFEEGNLGLEADEIGILAPSIVDDIYEDGPDDEEPEVEETAGDDYVGTSDDDFEGAETPYYGDD